MLYNPHVRLSKRNRAVCTIFGLVVLIFTAVGVAPARAGSLDIVVQNTKAAQGTFGQLEVVLVNNSDSAVNIAAYGVHVSLSDTSNVAGFSGTFITITPPYIFSNTGQHGSTSFAGLGEAAQTDRSNTSQVVNPGETWGLVDLPFFVRPTAPLGTLVPVMLELNPLDEPPPFNIGTFLTDAAGGPVPFNLVNGTITVTAIPEPASAALLAISSVALVLRKRFVRSER